MSSQHQLKHVRGTLCYEPDLLSRQSGSFRQAICKQDEDCYSVSHVAIDGRMESKTGSTVQEQMWSNTWSAIRDGAEATLTLKDFGNHTGYRMGLHYYASQHSSQ